MSHSHFIFTDAIKDVIGNEPVLDEFDISYEASFYGTTQDSFITGTMLSQLTYVSPLYNKNAARKTVTFVTGSRPRGKLFSIYYSDSQQPLNSATGSDEASQVPALSYRAVPWNTRVSSTSYRIQQCFDSSERYYDSCLPDLNTCFAANGAQIWTTSNNPQFWWSPYGNVQTASIGYMYFNSQKGDFTSYGYKTDPMVNNDWTWSYPYENKYEPQRRIVKTNNALGLNDTHLTLEWSNYIASNLTQSVKPKSVSGILPILPGRLDRNLISPFGGRNSYRMLYTASGAYGEIPSVPSGIDDPRLDDLFGVSYLIPADVQLNKQVSHSYLSAYAPAISNPGPSPLTGSMSLNDTVKFLFGFGDLNNMTWSKRLFIASSGSTKSGSVQTFETLPAQPNASSIPVYTYSDSDRYIQIDWSQSPNTSPWKVKSRANSDANKYLDTYSILSNSSTASSVYYNYVNSVYPNTESKDRQYGLFWLSSSLPSNTYFLMSDTYATDGGSIPTTGINTSYAVADVTSSYPWALRYKRAIASHSTDFLWVYFAGLPGIPSQDLGGIFALSTIEILTGSATATGKFNVGLMQQYDSRDQGFGNSNVSGSFQFPGWDYPLAPGAYRIVFMYWTTNTSLGGTIGYPSKCGVDDLEIFQYPSGCFPPDVSAAKYGANNYPYFQTYRVDSRYNPISSPPFSGFVTGSAYPYQGDVFGISPMIRGWKYGLYSGLPMNSKAIFRRGRFGQFRDMLEQRQYTKFISAGTSPTDNDAIVINQFDKDNMSTLNKTRQAGQLGPSVVEVNFVRQKYKKDERGIGYIYNEKVDPSLTISQNLSVEVTSSLPYFDGVAKLRQETDLSAIKDVTTVSVSLGTNNLTVL